MNLLHEILSGKRLVLDGPLGTELDRRGVDISLPLWSARAIRENPEIIEAIHRDYIDSGADIITTNTFRTNPRTFQKAGLTIDAARTATFSAVEIARKALKSSHINKNIWIAGSMSPLEDCYPPGLSPDSRTALAEHRLMADWLAEAGVDFILIETMNNIQEASTALQAAKNTGLPAAVSFILKDIDHLLNGEKIVDAYKLIFDLGVDIFSINCTHHSVITDFLNKYRNLISIPLMVYPNAGILDSKMEWHSDSAFTPERFTEIAADWYRRGVRIIGGCCGTGPEFIGSIYKKISGELGETHRI